MPHRPGRPGAPLRPTLLATGIIGAGLMAAIDEIVFHQLLAWHHFYDRSTSAIGLVSDGILHAATLIAVVGGFFWFAELRRRAALVPRAGWGGLLVGAGAFQVFDGVVDHKLLRTHQIRYGVELLPYDVAWNLGGVLMAAVGGLLIWRALPRVARS